MSYKACVSSFRKLMAHFVCFVLFGGQLPRTGSRYRAANDPEATSPESSGQP